MYPSKLELCGDVLARRLKNRPDRDSLIDRNIIPAHIAAPGIHDKVTLLERKKTGDLLQKKIRSRPSRQQLIQRHILTETRVDPSLLENMGRLERQRITDSLNERLQARPGPIELIQEGILPVDSPLHNALEDGTKPEFSRSLSPESSVVYSPKVAELESGITTLNCTSPSPPLHDSFSESYKSQFHNVTNTNGNINPNCLVRKASVDSNLSYYTGQTPISLSQKENEKLVRTINKKPKPPKTKVKKLKFHECRPPEMINQEPTGNTEVDERYKKLLEQQTLYLRLQVLWQNAMVNALQGNTESVESVTEEMENAIKKEVVSAADGAQLIRSIKGKKLDDLRVIDLRAQLKQRGLLVSGTKAKLIERLAAFEQGRTTAADFGYSANGNISHLSSLSTVPKGEITPVSTVVQVTTYSTSSGQSYQVIQAVPQQTRNVYQVLPAHCIPATHQIPQIQLNHVNIHPVVQVTEPHVMTIEDAASDVNLTSINKQQKSNSQLHSQMTQQSDHTTPTILIHSGPQLQKASLLQHEKPKVQMQQYPDFSHPYQMSQPCKVEPTSHSQYNQSKYIISPTKNDINIKYSKISNICQQLSGVKTHEIEEERKLSNCNQNNNFRSRSSSEPQDSTTRHKDYNVEQSMKPGSSGENFRGASNHSTLSPPGYKPTQHKCVETPRRDTYDDIMDIIGELSTPSPSNAGSPLMTTSSSPSFQMVSSTKVENPPPYNACAYTNPKVRNTENKCLNVSPQHNKLFSSVPENMNTLGSNNNNNFLSSPYGSLSPNSLNGSLNSNLSGSLSSLQTNPHSNSYNNLNHSSSIGNMSNHFSSDSNIPQHSSSTGNIPQQIQSDNYQRLPGSPNMSGASPYGTSPNTSSNYLKTDYRAVSPMDLHPDDNIGMDVDNFSSNSNQNSTLGWLDLNMETNSPNNLQYQSIPPKEMHRGNSYFSAQNSNSNMGDMNPSMVHANALYGNNTRTQNTIYSGNSRVPDGCISLFDLDGADY